MKNSIREHLEKQNVPVKEVADTLTSLSCDAGEVHEKFFKSHFHELFNASDHYELFGRMNSHWNYLNYHPLDHLVQMHDIDEAKERMKAYKSDLRKFRVTTPLAVFCKAQTKKRTEKPADFKEMVATFDWAAKDEVTLEDAEKFRQAFVDYYSLREFALMLEEVRPGSFIVTWVIAEMIVAKLSSNIPTELLRKFFVTKLIIAGACVYESKLQVRV